MKVLLVCTERLPVPCIRGGAIQTYIDGILPYLSKHHECTVFCVAVSELPDREVRNGVRYVRVAADSVEEYYQQAAKFVALESWDSIVIYNRPKYLPIVAAAAPNSRFLLSMHNEMFSSDRIAPEVARSCLERVDAVVTISKFIANGIAELWSEYRHKLHPVYAGVDLNRFQPRWVPGLAERRSRILKSHGLQGRQIVLYVGRLIEKKGPDLLVSAMTEIVKKYPSAMLLLVGSKWYGSNEENDYVRELKDRAKILGDAVQFTGFIVPTKVSEYFLMGDVFVCTSQWQEPLARVHYEAMATGLPIVTTDRGGNKEVIIPGKNALLVTDFQNPDAFAARIDYLLSNPGKTAEMGRSGRQLAELYYSWSRVGSELVNILDSINTRVGAISMISTGVAD